MKIKRSGRSRPKNEETGGGCAKTLALRLCCGYSGEGGGRGRREEYYEQGSNVEEPKRV